MSKNVLTWVSQYLWILWTATTCPTTTSVSLDTRLDNDGDRLAITASDAVAASEVPPWNWRETPGTGWYSYTLVLFARFVIYLCTPDIWCTRHWNYTNLIEIDFNICYVMVHTDDTLVKLEELRIWYEWNCLFCSIAAGEGPPPLCGGRIITVKLGEYQRRIGIDGTSDAIKEAIKAAFGLRTKRAFWLVDEANVVRSIDRDMPLCSYTLHVDEGKRELTWNNMFFYTP